MPIRARGWRMARKLIEPFGDAHAHPMCEAINIGHGFIDIGRDVHDDDHDGFAQGAHGDAAIAAQRSLGRRVASEQEGREVATRSKTQRARGHTEPLAI